MTRKTIIRICVVAVVAFLVLYEVISLYNTGWRPFLFLEIALFSAILIVFAIFHYEWGRYSWAFFEWIARPRVKPPDFSCVRCQSIRIIIHERTEDNHLHRHFWCKDCGYEWSNIDPNPQTDLKSTKE